jgi:NADH-quinone oxidoreductase subunit L
VVSAIRQYSYLLTLGALMTAGYMGRLFWIAFLGEPKSDEASHAKESPLTMLLPLIVLAVLSIAGGWMGYWPESLGGLIKGEPRALASYGAVRCHA